MFRRITILAILTVLSATLGLVGLTACGSEPQTAEKGASVTFVGNSGFLVSLGDKEVLIDGMFAGFPDGYTQPQELIDQIARAEPPFDGIDLILVTHAHDDHFDALRVAEYLEVNPKAEFLSTEEAVGQVLAYKPDLKNRVTAIALKSGESRELEVNGMRVVAYDISHGFGPNGETFPNLGFLVEVNGVKAFHAGDMDTSTVTATSLKMLGLPAEAIDIAFLPHFVFRNIADLTLATDGVAARYYVPIHYAYTTPSFSAFIIQQVYPDAVLFDQELDTWTMPQNP